MELAPHARQIEGIKEADNVPTAFSQMQVLALPVDFLFLNRYIESGALAPYSAVGRIVRRILRRKKWSGSVNHNSVYVH